MAADGDDDDRTSATAEEALAALSHRTCPPLAETLLAVGRVWRPVAAIDVDGWLDELALPLFTVAPAGEERAAALAGAGHARAAA